MLKGFKLPSNGIDLRQTLSDIEDHYIALAVERCSGNLSQAAKLLGYNRTTLVEKIKRKELPFVSRKFEVTVDPEGEFTYTKHDDGKRWRVLFRGEPHATLLTLSAVNKYIQEKCYE